MASPPPIGDRIARQRRQRGLSQAQLAGRLGRTVQWLANFESGRRPVDRYSVLAAIAEELRVPVAYLTSQASAVPHGLVVEPKRNQVLADLRRVLTTNASLPDLMLGNGRRQTPSLEAGDLRFATAMAWQLLGEACYWDLGNRLPELITTTEAAAWVRVSYHREAMSLLAQLYQVAAMLAAQLGDIGLGWVAADRSVCVAAWAREPMLAAAGQLRLSQVFLIGDNPDQARQALASVSPTLNIMSSKSASPEALVIWGALNLVMAVAMARRGDEAAARSAMRAAREAASRQAEDASVYAIMFGPTSVDVHAVSVAVELGRPSDALRKFASVDCESLSVMTHAQLLVDVARAHAQLRSTAKAVSSLLKAESIAPQMIQYDKSSSDLVQNVLRRSRRPADRELSGLALRMGLVAD